MAKYLHGVHVPHRKKTRHKPILRMNLPQSVTIPMSMHIGAPSVPIVKVGDEVKVGQKIAEAGGFVSVPIYSSVSGKVTKLADYLNHDGKNVPALVIQTDGEQTVAETVVPPVVTNREQLLAALKESGIVGLGGAGFPTHVKFHVEPERIDYLIINGAECEPYVTSDTMTMMERADDMEHALRVLCSILGIRKVIVGIENNKKRAAVAMRQMASAIVEADVSVKMLPSVYPQGGERVLIYHTTGRVVPEGKLPIDANCVVINCTTLAAIGAYLKTGMPLVEKCVTVDGGAVANPQNVLAPVGAPLSALFDACGGLTCDPDKIIYGGPMMGVTVPDVTAPVMTNTNAVMALTAKEAWLPKTTACIRCGSCTNHCPFGLAPMAISHAYKCGEVDVLKTLNVESCMLCGCCSFVCPANRPLVQRNKLAKELLKELRAKEGN
ncbi:MAG: electron transport complex subunit RsxC [Clostridia bacterium]|nr:electron transport complex subunit RsxC [Clostridia bacterium]